MKTRMRRIAVSVALLATAVVTTAAIEPAVSIRPGSRVWVEGTSTVRDYSCEAAEVKGRVEAAAATLDVAALKDAVRSAELAVSVAGLDCGNGTMNGHMRKALKGAEHGSIEFRLQDYTVVPEVGQSRVQIMGTLRIAGQDRPLVVGAVATAADSAALRVKGSGEILMTEFGIKPPSLMMGTMKVHDRVKINFDLVLEP